MKTTEQDIICAHTGKPAVLMRTDDDCMICCLAMFTGRSYDEVLEAALRACADFPPGGPMTHSVMRCLASHWGFALLSSIYMLWTEPAIIGVVSATAENCGHAVFWDGTTLIDPHPKTKVGLEYVHKNALEFTQRAADLEALVRHDKQFAAAARTVSLHEYW